MKFKSISNHPMIYLLLDTMAEEKSINGLLRAIIPKVTRSGIAITGMLVWICLFLPLAVSGQGNPKSVNGLTASESGKNPERNIIVATLQAGIKHGENGNPGSDVNDPLHTEKKSTIVPVHSKTQLGIRENQFTLNGKPTFLYGISYYGALGASAAFIRKDLTDMKKNSFNWIRIWANWTGFDADISAVDDHGNPRKAFLDKLKWIVMECDRKGIIVDVTLSHGDGLNDFDAHQRAVETLITILRPYRNWYLDLANERDIRDTRFIGFGELKRLHEAAKKLYPQLLITASAGNDISRKNLKEYLQTVQVDFISPHRPRDQASPLQTKAKSLEYLAWMKDLGQIVPIHYQEPFRRGYTQWQPKAEDYITDLNGARAGGAAGWCLHNGDQREISNGIPRRSFDMREKRLFDQLDKEELRAIKIIDKLMSR